MIRKFVLVITLVFIILAPGSALANQKWQGTDDLLDKKMQEVTGVPAKKPLIDITKGNLGLFLFATGGFTAGIVVGYQWRKIFGEKAGERDD